jgi:hypothetical protein
MRVGIQGFRLGRPFGILPKKKKCPKEPRPNLPNVLRFYDQIGCRLSVFLSNCSGTPFLLSGCSAGDSTMQNPQLNSQRVVVQVLVRLRGNQKWVKHARSKTNGRDCILGWRLMRMMSENFSKCPKGLSQNLTIGLNLKFPAKTLSKHLVWVVGRFMLATTISLIKITHIIFTYIPFLHICYNL